MNAFRVLLRKELEELLRTNRIFAITAVLATFAIGGMVALLFLPELLSLAEETSIVIPEQTAADALTSYHGNILQIGLITVILVAMGSVARERERGTATIILSKPVSTAAYVTAKITAYVSTVILIGLILGLIAVFYSGELFPGETDPTGSILMILTEMAYLAFVATITVASSCMTSSQFKAAGIAFASLLALTAGAALPWIGDYTPGAVTTWGSNLMLGANPEPHWPALAIMIATATAFAITGWWRLRTTEV